MNYVHGYEPKEGIRLQDQATTLVELLHSDTAFAAGTTVLEVGCGVGAQTAILAAKSPAAIITAIDRSEKSLLQARRRIEAGGHENVTFLGADIFDLPFPPATFDHVFVCFVLEHLERPVAALAALKTVLKPGGTITVIEGDHGSTFFYPRSTFASKAVECQVTLQSRARGNALIGRELYPLLAEAGFGEVRVSPRMVYADSSKPELADGFTRKTFAAMIEGIRASAVAAAIVSEADFDRGIADLHRTADPDGVFCYTFFKAVATDTNRFES